MSSYRRKYKVRRFGQLYAPRRSAPVIVLRTVLTVTLVFVLAFVGWNAYGPVRDYFTGTLAASLPKQEAPAQVPSSAPAQEEEAPPPAEPEPPADLRAVYLPSAVLNDRLVLDTVFSRMEGTQINAVLFDLKEPSGVLRYRSSLEQAAEAGAQAEDTFDLAEVCVMLAERGLTPVGRLSAFADPIASARLKDAGIKYMNTNMLWLDNSVENGGKGWLNPYAAPAREYLAALVSEAAEMGVERIVLDQFSFPTGVGLEFANYGENAESIAQADVLEATLKALEAAAGERCGLSLYVSGPAALGEQNMYYGDRNPLTLYSHVTLGLMPALFGDGYSAGDFSLEAPVTQPYETVGRLLEELSPALAGKETAVMVQGYTATGALENNKVYQREDIESQVRALQEGGVTEYIIYSPGGSYPAE